MLACHPCPHRQAECSGACACRLDGRDIIDHAKANDCPHPDGSRFDLLPDPPAREPSLTDLLRGVKLETLGDDVGRLIERFGGDKVAAAYERLTGRPCGCASRKRKLNRIGKALAGWLGKSAN